MYFSFITASNSASPASPDASPSDPRQWLSNDDISRMLKEVRAQQVAMISDEQTIPAGKVFFREGDKAEFLYIITDEGRSLRRELLDVFTSIRHHTTLEEAGRRLAVNRHRHLVLPQWIVGGQGEPQDGQTGAEVRQLDVRRCVEPAPVLPYPG